jgi:hypothetical protein
MHHGKRHTDDPLERVSIVQLPYDDALGLVLNPKEENHQ